MQTLDVQNDMQPVKYTEAVQSGNQEKKGAKEPDQKGTSFANLIKKLMAEEPKTQAAGKETVEAGFGTAEKSAGKKNIAAMQAGQSRLKDKNRLQKNDMRMQHTVEAQAAESADPRFDVDSVLATEERIDIKNALESGAERQLRTALFDQTEAESAAEGAVSLSFEEMPYAKKQKNGKVETGLSFAGSTAGIAGKQGKNSETAAAEDIPEKGRKAQQVKQHKPVFSVIDERTVHAAPVSADGSVHEAGAAVRIADTPSVDMTAGFRDMAGSNSASSSMQAAKEGSAQSFSSLVAQQIQDMAPDFVQAGKIVLQDNNAGVIRLQLQPAHLGNVRINLELTGDKKIAGKIIAGSKEAYDAFKESIEQLSKAFEQGGFSSAQFDVSWSGEGGGRQFGNENDQFNTLFTQNDRLEVMQGNRYADTETVYAFGQDQAVNVFA